MAISFCLRNLAASQEGWTFSVACLPNAPCTGGLDSGAGREAGACAATGSLEGMCPPRPANPPRPPLKPPRPPRADTSPDAPAEVPSALCDTDMAPPRPPPRAPQPLPPPLALFLASAMACSSSRALTRCLAPRPYFFSQMLRVSSAWWKGVNRKLTPS
jgi:hypothetical protein